MMKKILSGFLVLALLICIAPIPAYAQSEVPEGYRQVCENADFRLLLREEKAQFILEDKQTGVLHASAPSDAELEAEEVKGVANTRLQSVVIGSYYDLELKTITDFFSASGDVQSAKTIEFMEDGFRVNYTLPNALKFALEVRLLERGVSVCIPKDSVKETEQFAFRSFQLAPNFFVGTAQDEGYLFVPDGSGAVINFANGQTGVYDEPVYGINRAFIYEAYAVEKQDIYLPVFGIEKNGGTVLGVITSGAADARITASTSGNITPFNRAGVNFVLREQDEQHIAEDAFQTVIQTGNVPGTNLAVSFLIGSEEQSGYVGMAHMYREYLMQNGVQAAANVPSVVVSLYGAVRDQQKIFGVPLYAKATIITESDYALQILREISAAAGVPVTAVLHEWDKNAVLGFLPKSFAPINGGGLRELLAACSEEGMPVYLGRRAATFERQGKGIRQNRDAVRNLANELSAQYRYSLATSMANYDAPISYFANALAAQQQNTQYLESMSEFGFAGICYSDIAQVSYADYHRGSEMTQSEAAAVFADMMAHSAQQTNVMVSGGFDYALQNTQIVLSAPTAGSSFTIADAEVPFYQIALSGLRGYTTRPVNASAMQNEVLLQALETGAALHYEFIADSDVPLRNTRLENLYGASYSETCDTAFEQLGLYAGDVAQVAGRRILGHVQLADGVYETIFEGGITVIVNYGQAEYSAAGVSVPAGGYSIHNS